MLKISKKVEYALMSLKYMMVKGEAEGPFSAREICDTFHIPFDTLAKVMQMMTNEGILRSAQGVKGGYFLYKNLSDINYYDLNVLLEGESFGHYCNGPKGVCDQFNHCNIFGPLHRLDQLTTQFFKQITLSDLLQEELKSFPASFSNSAGEYNV